MEDLVDRQKIISRINELCGSMMPSLADGFVMAGSKEALEQQTWLSQALLVVQEILSPGHSFCKLAISYVTGGGQIGVQGMTALLVALRREIEAGTLDSKKGG